MSFVDELKTLAKLPRSRFPFLTLYLNTRWDSEKQREKVRIFVKTRLREVLTAHEITNGEARQSLERDVGDIENYVKGLINREWDEGYNGVAFFSCAGLGIHTLIRSRIPFDDVFHCADRPALRLAAQQLHEGEAAVLCVVGGSSGRVLEFELGALRREFRFHDEEFPSRHEQGGWSQSRFQRHVEEHLSRNLKALAEQLVKWVDEKRIRRVLLSGTDADVASFEHHLPKRIGGLVCARLRFDPAALPDVLQEEVGTVLETVRQAEDGKAVDGLLDKGVGSGRGVSGSEPVSLAVGAGKVHTLYLDDTYQEVGWKCFSCQQVGVKVPLGCPSCGGPVETVDLGEEFVRATLAADGKVIVVHGQVALRAGGGVAAAVRYS